MTNYNLPHVHWFPAGDYVGLYIHDGDHDQWTRIDLASGRRAIADTVVSSSRSSLTAHCTARPVSVARGGAKSCS